MHGVVRVVVAPLEHRRLEEIEAAGHLATVRRTHGFAARRQVPKSHARSCFCIRALEKIANPACVLIARHAKRRP
jgi:hypothetical protein